MAKTVKGVVVDASDKEPIVGASVLIKGTSVGASTNIDGEFTLNAPDNAKTIVVSYIGMNTREVAITGGTMTIELTSTSQNLDEVIVVAYGAQKKSSITGAISQVKSEEIEKRPVSSVASALEGASTGITVTGAIGSPGSSPTIRIRGIGSVDGSSNPLYVVDGAAYDGNLTDLNPDDIESMSVLKDAASCALYGNRAANGVILVTTKKAKAGSKVSFNFKTTQGWYERGLKEYERVGIADYMAIEYQNMFNGQVSGGKSIADAAEYTRKNLMSQRLFTNIFNAPGDALFDDNGRLLPSVSVLPGYASDLDWWDQSTRKGYRGEYQFSGSGATDKSDYYFSLGYLSENGYMQKSGFDRISGRANINIRPKKWFKAGLSIDATHQKYENSKGTDSDESSSYVNPVYFSRYIAPIYPVHAHNPITGELYLDRDGNPVYDSSSIIYDLMDEKGNFILDENGNRIAGTTEKITRQQNSMRHSIMENELNSSRTIRNTMNSIAYADFILPYGFTVTVKGNLSTRNSEQREYGSAQIGDATGDVNGRGKKTIYNRKTWNFQQQIRWNQTYNSKHTVDVLFGHENYSMYYDYTYAYKSNEAFSGSGFLSNFSVISNLDGYRTRYKTESYLARVQYNYDDRYNIEGSWRRDGSSRFHPNHRWGNFGSFGANWVFSNEEFMKDITWLNNGKLRVNWGQVGSDSNVDYYGFMPLYYGRTNASLPAYFLYSNANDLLSWETGESWGIGLETRLFDRWNLSVEYYNKANKDLLFDVKSPASAGATYNPDGFKPFSSVVTQNTGTIENRGIEINTDVDIWKNRDWTFNFAANLTTLKNKVTKLPEQMKEGYTEGTKRIEEGRDRYSYYLYHYEGVDMHTGDALYTPDDTKYYILDADKNVVWGTPETTEIKSGAYTEINGKYYVNNTATAKRFFNGTALPSVYGSFTGNIRYKNFNVSAMFTYSLGGKMYDSSYINLMGVSSKNTQAYHVDLLKSWTEADRVAADDPNRVNPNGLPAINGAKSDNYSTCDRWLCSRDYLVFKNLNVSYKLPKKVLKALDVENVIVNFAAENLFTKTARQGMSAQQNMAGTQSNMLVTPRVFTFGLQIKL